MQKNRLIIHIPPYSSGELTLGSAINSTTVIILWQITKNNVTEMLILLEMVEQCHPGGG